MTDLVCSETSKELIDAELGLTEDYFSRPVDHVTASEPDVHLVMGHKFMQRKMEGTHEYCDKCCNIILGVMHNWYYCKNCSFKCHNKCVNFLTRICAYVKVVENPSYILDICPETSLATQCYKCAECKRRIFNKEGYHRPRKCDYSGFYYCSYCHWNSQMVIPSRIIHNWDFEPRTVCRASLQFLRIMMKKPVLQLEQLNPMLFSFVEELNEVKKLREEILLMKQYLASCHVAQEEQLLLEPKERQHLVENADMYSLRDLIDLKTGVLKKFLRKIYSMFSVHITKECEGCRGKGFICELCKNVEVIFPFEDQSISCFQCSTVFHKECYMKRKNCCPKCKRRQRQIILHQNL
ncbi:differentially expressed in FDCP 8 homolog isoform X1 [Limulus polyphemus]|uniref:Differentially expressed in FDCP 8 homolog isoform X1 n=2 Tax=Limulus polyphemus TaxID=6850 RepID=A0ABM1SX73_LIMPO|nr:differentially expressed in FDCP 8 homolog isoform X1 [Limulus polyphemus]XP_022248224.1 differentially expressed in FDCP 8 homolog isoform X1 [Limulus polyphemus]XP_022248225.1 differentially expressed in FDCP 8 homolog isoform X1 [Limulus polyphemus]XP_022248226.1 differentially expressed in FDCP 8 homolog isoform X1 [Limulus polyphemus]XP_022248227.1 differentially expressed in FDCP 8 homolog isoform X1 [Limulus polyphemus]XP_022248228.1 differentially expressed in FDCP 8 homolog isoform